jgi:hypothetical protein
LVFREIQIEATPPVFDLRLQNSHRFWCRAMPGEFAYLLLVGEGESARERGSAVCFEDATCRPALRKKVM